ncbi:MAG: hypothetical protein M3416_02855 [Acidobacteriota bacterium]|nr:hypothetical protein [Acidobacteriota bacterium]
MKNVRVDTSRPGCNLAKGSRDLFEWHGGDRWYEIPRLVLGKYLKMVFEAHERAVTLDAADLNADECLDVFDPGAVLEAGCGSEFVKSGAITGAVDASA